MVRRLAGGPLRRLPEPRPLRESERRLHGVRQHVREPATGARKPRGPRAALESGAEEKNGGGGGSRTPVRSARTSRFSTLSPDLFFLPPRIQVWTAGRGSEPDTLGSPLQMAEATPARISRQTPRRPGQAPRRPSWLIRPRERSRWCWQLVVDRRFYERTAVLGVLLDR